MSVGYIKLELESLEDYFKSLTVRNHSMLVECYPENDEPVFVASIYGPPDKAGCQENLGAGESDTLLGAVIEANRVYALPKQ